jgi:hypothetical protein
MSHPALLGGSLVGLSALAALTGEGDVMSVAPWLASGAALAFWLGPGHDHGGREQVDPLDLHLMRSRRRDESAWVLVARVDGPTRTGDLLSCLRLTDSARVMTTLHGDELACVLDAEGLDREGLERRLRAAAADADVRFGWSRFPEDGAALDVLMHAARAGLPRLAGRLPTRPAGAVASLEVESE